MNPSSYKVTPRVSDLGTPDFRFPSHNLIMTDELKDRVEMAEDVEMGTGKEQQGV